MEYTKEDTEKLSKIFVEIRVSDPYIFIKIKSLDFVKDIIIPFTDEIFNEIESVMKDVLTSKKIYSSSLRVICCRIQKLIKKSEDILKFFDSMMFNYGFCIKGIK